MTPNNIVNMAVVNGLDIIAITDHNGVGNLKVIEKCAEGKPLIFIPGIEVETKEEVHIICLFGTMETAISMGNIVDRHQKFIKNKSEIFGRQLLLNHRDQIIGEEENLQIISTNLAVEEVFDLAEERGGCALFAHIDRDANSIYSLLGSLPTALNKKIIEVANRPEGREFLERHAELRDNLVLFSSDAHRLREMNRGEVTLDIPIPRRELTREKIVEWLREKGGGVL